MDYSSYSDYARVLRHELHQCPEIGFDLPQTLAIVRRELTKMGIPFTEKWSRSSVVATINEEKAGFTIGLRADMDALPILEKSGNPYSSKNEGVMHACGHDVHTANLLAVGKYLQEHREEINCRVKLLFTPAEEYIEPGCRELAESGVMEDIDCAVACHVYSERPVGQISISKDSPNANSMGFTAEFFGKSAHAHSQHKGCDAINMAVQAYNAMEMMVAKEAPALEPKILNIGAFNGGKTNNIICDYCKMFGSCRTQSDEVSAFMERRMREICEHVAKSSGGEAKFTVNKFLPYVKQHPVMYDKLVESASKVIGRENVTGKPRSLGGEDFGYLSRKKPSVIFQLGTNGGTPATSCPLHNDHFDVDERCFDTSVAIFVQFVMDNMNGIEF